MEELVARIVSKVGIDESVARDAIGIIFTFLRNEAPADKIAVLVAKIPGAATFMADDDGDSAETLGGLGGLMGGGAMAVVGKLQTLGLGLGAIQGVTQETIGFAREKAGDEAVREVVGAIPGLSQFL
jgi:hypothetical protein